MQRWRLSARPCGAHDDVEVRRHSRQEEPVRMSAAITTVYVTTFAPLAVPCEPALLIPENAAGMSVHGKLHSLPTSNRLTSPRRWKPRLHSR